VVTRHGRAIVALVSADDLARLEQLDAAAAEPTVIRLGGGPTSPAGPPPPATSPTRYDIAARYQPPGTK
jgi:hypothetical protein